MKLRNELLSVVIHPSTESSREAGDNFVSQEDTDVGLQKVLVKVTQDQESCVRESVYVKVWATGGILKAGRVCQQAVFPD